MSLIKLSKLKITAIAPSDKERGCYALFADNRLYIADVKTQTATEAASLPNIQKICGDGRRTGKEQIISIVFHHPYVCVTERFGVNGALINLNTGEAREFEREDHHSDVSSFSAGFAETSGRVMFIRQTQWNRLDIHDAASGENLTEREVYCRDSEISADDGNPLYENKNYLDYFHSELVIAPDGKHFLSNGWVWQPADMIYLFNTDEFLKSYELCWLYADTSFCPGYSWDRPVCFIDDDTFVVALDDARKTGALDDEDQENYEYRQLAFFKTSAEVHSNQYGHRWIEPYRTAKCAAFAPDKNGEVTGKLHFDETSGRLIAITPDRGAFVVSMDGGILENMPDIKASQTGVFTMSEPEIGWDYCAEHRVFYTWRDGTGIVEMEV